MPSVRFQAHHGGRHGGASAIRRFAGRHNGRSRSPRRDSPESRRRDARCTLHLRPGGSFLYGQHHILRHRRQPQRARLRLLLPSCRFVRGRRRGRCIADIQRNTRQRLRFPLLRWRTRLASAQSDGGRRPAHRRTSRSEQGRRHAICGTGGKAPPALVLPSFGNTQRMRCQLPHCGQQAARGGIRTGKAGLTPQRRAPAACTAASTAVKAAAAGTARPAAKPRA